MEWTMEHSYTLCWAAGILLLLLFYIRRKKCIRRFLLGGCTGVLSLVALHCCGGILGFVPSLSLTNLVIAVLFGIPGVALIQLGGVFLL